MCPLSPDFTEDVNELLRQSHRVEDTVGFDFAGYGDGTVFVLNREQRTLLVQVHVLATAKCHDVAPWL